MQKENINRVKFAGTWYYYEGSRTEGNLFIHAGARFPYARLKDGRVTKADSDELLGDVEGLLFKHV